MSTMNPAYSLPRTPGPRPTLLTATRGEAIKVTTLTGTWSGMVLAVAALVGLPAMMMTRGTVAADSLGVGSGLSLIVAMTVCAVLATSDLQHGTARLGRWVDPRRWHGYAAKVVVSAGLGALVGLVGGLGILALALGTGVVDSVTGDVLRASLGEVPVFALGCGAASTVGLVIGRTGLAVATVIIWVQLVETMLPGLPTIGEHVRSWLPFMNAFMFTMPGNFEDPRPGVVALGYFAACCVAIVAVGGAVVTRRDI